MYLFEKGLIILCLCLHNFSFCNFILVTLLENMHYCYTKYYVDLLGSITLVFYSFKFVNTVFY